MPILNSDQTEPNRASKSSRQYTSAQYARLKSEASSPYRGLRKFIYASCGASGAIGAFVFFTQLLAGKGELELTLGNLALQIGIVTLMVVLFRVDREK
jgi:hypothetical protein